MILGGWEVLRDWEQKGDMRGCEIVCVRVCVHMCGCIQRRAGGIRLGAVVIFHA